MKRNLLLLSSTLLLLNVPVLAADSTGNGAPAVEQSEGIWAAPQSAKKTTPVQTVRPSKHGTTLVPPPPPIPKMTTKAAETKGAAPEKVKTSESNTVTVGTGGPYKANDKVQRFADYLELKQGMENAPLTLNITNGGFKWFRLLIANRVIATEKSLGSKTSGDFDITGVIQPGTNQIVIQAGGAPGATISWKVTTVATAKLDRIDPEEVLVGETVKLKGKNFSSNASADTVTFNSKQGKVVAASPTELQVKVPTDAEIGDNKVAVKVNGQSTNSVKLKIRGIPELTGSNLQGAPPGVPLDIFGKNFSKVASENKVMFGETPAQVVSATDTHLVVLVPYLPWTAGHQATPISVQVGKAKSKNTLSMVVGPQMFNDSAVNGTNGGRDVPIYSPRSGQESGNPSINQGVDGAPVVSPGQMFGN